MINITPTRKFNELAHRLTISPKAPRITLNTRPMIAKRVSIMGQQSVLTLKRGIAITVALIPNTSLTPATTTVRIKTKIMHLTQAIKADRMPATGSTMWRNSANCSGSCLFLPSR